MMIAATAGGYIGARIARLIPATVLRASIVAIGFTMAIKDNVILIITSP
jgi:uncharacterized membrane protein YfcA